MTIYHNHHIIPRHAGGNNEQENLVRLTVKEHAEAHRRLFEEHGRWQDELAYKFLSGLIGKDECMIKIYYENGHRVGLWNKDKPKSEEWKNKNRKPKRDTTKMLEARKKRLNISVSEETKKRISEGTKLAMQSENVRKKLREAVKHRLPISDKTRKKISQNSILMYQKKPFLKEKMRRKEKCQFCEYTSIRMNVIRHLKKMH